MSKKVVVFSSNTCGYCTMAKEYLTEKGVAYEERNVSNDIEARKELMSKGFMGVPVIYVEDEVIQGFNKAKLDELLGL
ncbi:glutaredoxin family protein [Fusibacter ferrireducens]|uniref:Glutaredoxin family protein n=1 Tax=Fusibacter ferrireducens TaxID=2785058 RepID=A0ABR9ZRV0_9FIRM|nr:glutaredoxin family protein [Fusibacter ferrireducens]MBF4693182.1 glutaredoxin family protein [Fusibacter ferrireducens]